jgi:hypothetical protein
MGFETDITDSGWIEKRLRRKYPEADVELIVEGTPN